MMSSTICRAGLVRHNQGTLRIGSSPGLVVVNRFENASSGELSVEIGGYLEGIEHDLLFISDGDALLDGIIDVAVIDAGGGLFAPQVGDSFIVLQAPGTVSGTFDNNPVSFVPGKVYLWSVLYGTSAVTLSLDDIVPCPADLSGDGMVDGADLGLLLSAWGPCAGCSADLNGDRVVDGADLGAELASWGACLQGN